VPTYEAEPRFWRDWERLTESQRSLFLSAVQQMVDDLRSHRRFHPRLRIKGYQGQSGVFEMTWAPDGRALFRYGSSLHAGDTHIMWLRIGSHDIFQRP
jgi:mRNA-degrading endonuclease YafQ of YafQ-DinJ toxin-antitoxin module